MKSSVKISRGQVTNVFKEYATIALLTADQANQSSNRIYKVIDASLDPNITFPVGETKLWAYYEYKETANGVIGDYDLISAPYGIHNRKQIKTISDTTYTLLESDNDKILQFTSATDVTVTVPTGLTLGNRFEGKQLGDGQITFVGAIGVTVNTLATRVNKTEDKYSVFKLDSTDTDDYVLYGNLELVGGEIMHLSYTATTSLNFLVETASGVDWEIDWGDGVWERYASSDTIYRTKTFGSATSGLARVRSATGRELSDLHRVQSTVGTWNFDVADLCATYHAVFSGASMTLTGDVGDIKATYYAFFNGASMTLTGDVGDIKATYYAYFQGNSMTLTGDVADIKATYQAYFNGTSMTLTGDVGDIKATYNAFFIGTSMTLTGDISTIKATNTAYFQGNSMTLTGDVADIKATYQAYFSGTSMTLTGDVADIKATYQAYFSGTSMTLTGDVGDIKATYYAYFNGNSMTLTGDVSDIKADTNAYFIGSSMTLTYTTTTWTNIPTNTFYLALATGHLTTSELSQMLIDMDASGITGTATLDFRYNNGAPNPSGVTAADNLRGKGYTVLTN